MKKHILILLAGSIALATSVTRVHAADDPDFPKKEINVIVNYGAGGGTDLSTRILAEAAGKILGQPLRVVNRAGGSGTVGPTFITSAKPDGYTIGVASFSPLAVAPHLQEVPYDLDDFRFIIGHARYRSGIAVSTESPYRTMEELIKAGQSGKEITYAATDALGAITMVNLGNATDVKFKWIRYKSGQEAATAALGGFVDVFLGNPNNITPYVKTGQFRLLSSASSVRWYELPEVSTLREQGYDVMVESYAGLAAPAGTPDETIKVLQSAFAEALEIPEVQRGLKDLGMEPVFMDSTEYETLLRDGHAAMARDLPKIGIVKK